MTWPEDPNVHICGTLDDIDRLDEMCSAGKKAICDETKLSHCTALSKLIISEVNQLTRHISSIQAP